jgi:hypothetical protein
MSKSQNPLTAKGAERKKFALQTNSAKSQHVGLLFAKNFRKEQKYSVLTLRARSNARLTSRTGFQPDGFDG